MCLTVVCYLFFFNDTATTEIYTLSLHDALPIFHVITALFSRHYPCLSSTSRSSITPGRVAGRLLLSRTCGAGRRSEEHTSELQSRQYLVCRLLLEKKKHQTTLRYHAVR